MKSAHQHVPETAGYEPTNQLVYEVVHRLSSLDQQDDPPGLLQLGHHVFQRLGPDHLRAFSLIVQEVVHFGHCTVVGANLRQRMDTLKKQTMGSFSTKEDGKHRKFWSYHKPVVVHVHDEVLAHDSQTNQSNVCPVKQTVSIYGVSDLDYDIILNIRHTAVHILKVFPSNSTSKFTTFPRIHCTYTNIPFLRGVYCQNNK